ncbi:hypothetical protein ACIBKY_53335 [Nonomuraea sp. NPDC050394]|uniref:hypothetical protein n=1 Tax=Nonomuraea sp. NPDC050394 TaxID=3364363 RepID=UPI00379FF926
MTWDEYLYETHTPEQLHGWANSLAYFHFCRAYGGHSNDGDRLLAALRTDDPAGVLTTLGLPVKHIPPGTPQAVPGQGYTVQEYARFPSPIPGHPGLDQPGWVTLAGHPAHVWATATTLTISVHDATDIYAVSESAVAAARAMERLLAPLSAHVIDPPQNDRNCVCLHRSTAGEVSGS